MGIVFAVLALLALSIKVLSMFDREPATVTAVGQGVGPAPTSPDASGPVGEITGQQVAAIAVALALGELKTAPEFPPAAQPKTGPSTGSWLQSGRMRSLGAALTPRGRRGR